MVEGAGQEPQVKVHLLFDSNAQAELKKMREELERLKGPADQAAGHLKHGGEKGGMAFAVAMGGWIEKAGEAALEKVHEVADEAVDVLKEAFAAGIGELEGQRAITGALTMTDQSGSSFDTLLDKGKLFKESLEDIGVEAGVADDVLSEVFGDIAARSNKSAVEVEELTKQIAEAGKAMPGGAAALGQGFAMMEMGVVKAKNPVVQLITATHLLGGNAKEVAKQMQKLSPEEQMKLGEKAIAKMADRMKDVPATFGQLVTSLSGLKEQTLEAMGLPMVGAVLPILEELKSSLMEHKDAIQGYAEDVGNYVGEGITALVAELKSINAELMSDGGHAAELLMDAGAMLKNVFEGGIKGLAITVEFLAGVVSQLGKWYSDAKGFLKGKAEGGAFGDTVAQMAHGAKRKDLAGQMEEAANSAFTPAGQKKFNELRAQYEKEAAAAGDSAQEIRNFENQMQTAMEVTQRMGSSVEKAAFTLDSKGFARMYKEASATHQKGTQVYMAELLAGSTELQHALFKSGEDINVAEMTSLLKGSKTVSPEDVAKLVATRKADAKGALTNHNVVFNGATFKIQQDFRDQDPDRVAVVFRRDVVRAAVARSSSRVASPFGL